MSFESSADHDGSQSSSSSDDNVYFKDDMEKFDQFKRKLKLKRNKTTNMEETKKFSPFKDNNHFDSGIHSIVYGGNHSHEKKSQENNQSQNVNIAEDSPEILKLKRERNASSPGKSQFSLFNILDRVSFSPPHLRHQKSVFSNHEGQL